ncbi:hypothetical protein PHYSODRAFT_339381 [Phytophthora sojae]|uniref:Uncharacterized protein n=1 Tax=Phytophthora sojae (strain P6497) TaxID=1094619 RepID=G5A6M2_PHYSP|nr:hypothetical protein PHYSODRAFT_339381 [Phytophthora sojae]EGZ08977.1 hypothetical protein PHYSODRAFT_339381 [Phytophthora sojae]|eukprot:XP_009535610.1 hypothetical protein PHYSODRAFT_339381 [Phytophthora sojae]
MIMTSNDDNVSRSIIVHSPDASTPPPTSPVTIVPREEELTPPQRRPPVSLPRQVQECTMQRVLVTEKTSACKSASNK